MKWTKTIYWGCFLISLWAIWHHFHFYFQGGMYSDIYYQADATFSSVIIISAVALGGITAWMSRRQ